MKFTHQGEWDQRRNKDHIVLFFLTYRHFLQDWIIREVALILFLTMKKTYNFLFNLNFRICRILQNVVKKSQGSVIFPLMQFFLVPDVQSGVWSFPTPPSLLFVWGWGGGICCVCLSKELSTSRLLQQHTERCSSRV